MDKPTFCTRCQDERGVYGVAMSPTIGGYACPDCGAFVRKREFPRSVNPFAERDARLPDIIEAPERPEQADGESDDDYKTRLVEYARQLADHAARVYDAHVEIVERREPGITHGGGSNGRGRKKPPKASDRISPKSNDPGLCWRCGGPTGTSDARVRYCAECADEAKRNAKSERDQRYRERRKGCA